LAAVANLEFLNREARLLVTALERISCVLTAKAASTGVMTAGLEELTRASEIHIDYL
jgi:hypothetical protein